MDSAMKLREEILETKREIEFLKGLARWPITDLTTYRQICTKHQTKLQKLCYELDTLRERGLA